MVASITKRGGLAVLLATFTLASCSGKSTGESDEGKKAVQDGGEASNDASGGVISSAGSRSNVGSGSRGTGGSTGTGGSGEAGNRGTKVVCTDGSDSCPDLECSEGYTCVAEPSAGVVWVMKNDGNINGPTCQKVCEAALSQSCENHACDDGRSVEHKGIETFSEIAKGLGFACKEGGCWWPDAPSEGQYLVSIETDGDGAKSCFFPTESALSCSSDPGNANCFGERYASVCPCVAKPLDEACQWECPPHNTTRAVWKTSGTSCLARINYWRKRACEEGWIECPPAGLPPMVECTACHECANSEAAWDKDHGAHDSFKRCGESAQGEGGGETCADVIDAFVSERAPDENGVMRCQGHCGPILAPGCRSFHWGKDSDSGFHTLNWGGCNAEKCEAYCDDNAGDCFRHETSPAMGCEDPDEGSESGPDVLICQ